jgi:hypothetical protein
VAACRPASHAAIRNSTGRRARPPGRGEAGADLRTCGCSAGQRGLPSPAGAARRVAVGEQVSAKRHARRRHMQCALVTDWLAEAAGFEHLHSRIEIAKTLSSRRQDSNLCILKSDLLHFGVLAVVRDARNLLRSEARAPAIRDVQVRVLSPQPASPVSVCDVRFTKTGAIFPRVGEALRNLCGAIS